MVKHSEPVLDSLFTALSDTTRRGIIVELLNGPRAVTELSAPFGMSLPGFIKHLQILEGAGLIVREKTGRTVQCALNAHALQPASEWLSKYREFWEPRLDALDKYLNQQEPPWPASKHRLRSKSSASTKQHRTESGKPGSRPKR